MDPLSAYRAVSAAFGANSPVKPGGSGEEAFAKIIPKAELDKLSSSVLTPKVGATPELSPASGASGASGDFSGIFGNMVREVSAKQAAAGDAMKEVMTGGEMPLHQAMIAAQEASVSFQLMVEVRNKLLESYQELMRMQV